MLCAIAIVSLFLPKEHKFHFSYQVDKPWEYSLLTAPFDIPIELDTATASALRDSIVRNFVNVYRVDRTVSSKQLQAFASKRNSGVGTSAERLAKLEKKLMAKGKKLALANSAAAVEKRYNRFVNEIL